MWPVNFQMFKLDLEKAEESDQIANIHCIIEKATEFQKNIDFCFIEAAFKCLDHNKLWKILKDRGIPDHLTCLLQNLYEGQGQEAMVRIRPGTTDWLKIGKGEHQGCILSPCLFNLYAEDIMWNARLDEHKLESRLPGKISMNSDMQMTPPLW